MTQIFSTHRLHPDVTKTLTAAGDYRVASQPSAAAILDEGLAASVLIVRAPIPADYFARATSLRAAVRHGAGLDMIPIEAATSAGVLVANVPGANASTVAEHAIFAAIGLLRQFRAMDAALRGSGWNAGRAYSDLGGDLAGRSLGLFGFGNIGRALYRMANGFDMPVAATTRRPETLPAGVKALSLDDLAARSDVLVLCCPLTDQTRGAINSARIARMKPGAVLINVSRGPIVDTDALIAALQSRRIAGAALDVFDTQPLPRTSPLWALENVILTPHMAGITADSMLRMGNAAADEVIRVLSGALPVNFCNPEVEPAYRARFPA
ncbi:MAG: NAD(P)-dependent oxidoreductase [Paracoccaceae bacterium]